MSLLRVAPILGRSRGDPGEPTLAFFFMIPPVHFKEGQTPVGHPLPTWVGSRWAPIVPIRGHSLPGLVALC